MYVYYIYMQCIHYIYILITTYIDKVPAVFGIDPSNDPFQEETPSYEFPATGRIILAFSEEVSGQPGGSSGSELLSWSHFMTKMTPPQKKKKKYIYIYINR